MDSVWGPSVARTRINAYDPRILERLRRTFGQYEIVARVGRGGMAEIFLARARGPAGFQKMVALKCVHPHLSGDEGFREMFLDEAKVAAALDHPAIVQIHGLGEVEGTFFIAMEYVPGQPLHRVVRKLRKLGRRLTPSLAVRIIAPIAQGLGYAHDRRDLKGRPLCIVHRDVSPQNIIVGFDGTAKLTDFGIAKAEGRSHGTSGSAVKGKVSYMAPEQVLAETLDGRADIFALGIVLYELVTGASPFRAPNDEPLATMRRITEYDPPAPSRLVPELGQEIDAIVLRALAKPRDRRWASAREFGEALERYAHSLGPSTASELAALMQDLFADEIRTLETVLRGIDDPSGMLVVPTLGSRPDLQAITAALTLPDTKVARPVPSPTPRSTDLAELPAAQTVLEAEGTIGTHVSWVNYSHTPTATRRTWLLAPLSIAAALVAGGLVLALSDPPGRPHGRQPHSEVTVRSLARDPEHGVAKSPRASPSREDLKRAAPSQPQPEPMTSEPARRRRRHRRPRPTPHALVPEPAVGEGVAGNPVPEVAAGGGGRVTIDADPWAQVFIGGRMVGETPVYELRVPAGPLTIELVNPEENLRTTVSMEVPRDGVVRRRFSLR